MRRVVLKDVGDWSDERLTADAKEAFYLNGADVSAEVERVEVNDD